MPIDPVYLVKRNLANVYPCGSPSSSPIHAYGSWLFLVVDPGYELARTPIQPRWRGVDILAGPEEDLSFQECPELGE